MVGWFTSKSKLLADRSLLGRWGEKYCEKFLKTKGLKTLTRNFSCRTGEIDLVMSEPDGSIVFVEVKTRSDESYQPAEAAVNQSKRKKLSKAAKYFLATNSIEGRKCRFDVVTIVLNPSGPMQIRHHINAFVN